MRYRSLDPQMFVTHRQNLKEPDAAQLAGGGKRQ